MDPSGDWIAQMLGGFKAPILQGPLNRVGKLAICSGGKLYVNNSSLGINEDISHHSAKNTLISGTLRIFRDGRNDGPRRGTGLVHRPDRFWS
jgi:hypothetical protein